MKANEITKGGKYIAKVSGNLTTVRVDEIRETSRSRMNHYSGRLEYTDKVVYDVTNLKTGRKTTFKSAAKFRRAADDPKPTAAREAVEQILGKELADAVTPMPDLFPADFEDDPTADDHSIPQAAYETWAKNQGL